jgi:hypothetical protein
MVGVHDYIIVQPKLTDTNQHGFKVYRDKMYAYVSIGEIDSSIEAYKKLDKKLIVGKNSAWGSDLLDITKPKYKKFLFEEMIEPQIKRGFKNFFFDTIDSYQLVAKTKEQKERSKAALVDIINSFHKRYPEAKLVINRGFEIIDKVHNSITAMLFESYYDGVGGKNLTYQKVSKKDRVWLDKQLSKVASYGLDIICVDYMPFDESMKENAKKSVQKLKSKGFIPYISTKDLNIYGYSSKNVIKREILTLIDESRYDRIYQGAHQMGAIPLEYEGYIQKLYDVSKHTLPSMESMQEYGGVVIWLSKDYKDSLALVDWILKLEKYNIKVVFANAFSVKDFDVLKALNISVEDKFSTKNRVVYQDKMVGYEVTPSLGADTFHITLGGGKPLYEVEDLRGNKTTLAAIMPWGGFAVPEVFSEEIGKDNLWVINPFSFFKQTLRLQPLPVPDTTTENGNRLFFSHVDGDGIMNRVEWNPKLFSGDTLYEQIFSKFKTPISVSVIGAEINKNGLYPKLAPRLQKIVKEIYSLPNIEPATHTFTHPFFWNKIKNGNLLPKYRLKPKGYKFSLDYEIRGMLDEINDKFLPKDKYPKAKTVFWSGDCIPTTNILRYVYKNHILNINGGDTYISNLHPWLSYIAPMGIERDDYYQIYTGAQNENIYTNEWLGPFWGFKKVVQTFKLTNKPRRLKPIDIYYHLYSGSKRASINALKYVYDWAMKQDVNPIFTSEFIPKVMDYYTVSMAKSKDSYLVCGLKNLKTVRFSDEDIAQKIDLGENIAGFNHFNKQIYLHIGEKSKLFIFPKKHDSRVDIPYLVNSNGSVISLKKEKNHFNLKLKAHVGLKFELFLPKRCHVELTNGKKTKSLKKQILHVEYKNRKEATIDVRCGV